MRPRVYVRVIEEPDGSLRRVESGGREIHGLSYARTSKAGESERGSFYTIIDGKRKHLTAELAEAVRAMTGKLAPLSALPAWVDPELPGAPVNGKPAPSAHTLSDCLSVWRAAKTAERATAEHIEDVARYFKAFVDCVGDLPLNRLTAEAFTSFRNSVNARRTYKDADGKTHRHGILWLQRHHKHTKHILKYVKWSYPSWGLPDGTLEWASAYQVVGKRERYVSDKSNRRAMPVAVFKKLLDKAQEWADTEIDADKATQSGRAKRNVQAHKRLEGLRVGAMLRLAINAGLANVDIMRIRWSNLTLTGELPNMDFPRRKTEDITGEVERHTPLLPATVKALQAVRESGNPSPFVFVAGRGAAYSKKSLDKTLARLFEQAPGWTFKHLRNVGGTLAKRAGMKDRIQEFLGHDETGTNKFYVDDAGAEYLTPVVNVIGKEYFDGEEVQPHGLRIRQGA